MKSKLLLSITLLLTSAFTATSASASSIESTSPAAFHSISRSTDSNPFLSEKDESRLYDFGFSQEEISNFTIDQYATFNEKVGTDTTGVLVDVETSYFKVTGDNQVTKVSESEAIRGVQKSLLEDTLKGAAVRANPDTQTLSWMVMTLSSTNMSNGYYNLKNSFRWLTYPTYRLTDVVGISFNPNLTYITNSDYGNYAASSAGASPTTDNYPLSAKHKDVMGIGFNVDLKSYTKAGGTVMNHSGYAALQVQKNNTNAISTNAFGHYAHLYNTISFSVNLASGTMSVSGATAKDYMSDTAVNWNF
ncbi:hypothetical protein PMSD_15005 [Paenibacillus macquariensis subsp. defensor]|nr:hypothetical protein PMSD_15005 [Paenibacillus macquariensis subsp. defensor]